jgi:site-specific DNA-methyltransferase (adenine-specific)
MGKDIENLKNKILCGDSAELLKLVPDNSIDLVITSPPYFKQRDYGKGIGNEEDVEKYIVKLLVIFHECVRLTKDEGNIVFNIGDKYAKSSLILVPYMFALEALKQERVKLVNAITWVKANPTPRQFKRRLVSSTEPFFHFVKTDKYNYDLNRFYSELDNGRKIQKNNKKKTTVGQRYYKLIADSQLTPQQKQLAETELKAVIEEVTCGKISGFRMKIKGIHAPAFGGQDGGRKIQLEKNGFTIIRINGDKLKRDVIISAVENVKGVKHPAVYPMKIIIELINLLTKENGVVLDPFIGSGTTALACLSTNRSFIGIEINEEYCDIARKRVAAGKRIVVSSYLKLPIFEEQTWD